MIFFRMTILTREFTRHFRLHVYIEVYLQVYVHMHVHIHTYMPWTFAGSRTGDYKIFNMSYGRVAIAINGNYVYPAGGCEITERNCLSIARSR